MLNSLDSDQDQHSVYPDLDPNWTGYQQTTKVDTSVKCIAAMSTEENSMNLTILSVLQLF